MLIYAIAFLLLSLAHSDDVPSTFDVECDAKCGDKDRTEQQCACDSMCTSYGDCCRDHELLKMSPAVPHGGVRCVETRIGRDSGSYFLVAACPRNWEDDYVREMCESEYPGSREEYLLPVASRDTRLSYKNMFCGLCNGVSISDLETWSYQVDYRECSSEVDTFAEVLNSSYKRSCTIIFTEKTRRYCDKEAIECPTVNRGSSVDMEKHKDQCFVYVEYIQYNSVTYRNIDCLLCAGKSFIPKFFKCGKSSGDGKVVALSAISTTHKFTEITAQQNLSVGGEITVSCDANKVFYRGTCVPLYCFDGYILKDGHCVSQYYYQNKICPMASKDMKRIKSVEELAFHKRPHKCQNNITGLSGVHIYTNKLLLLEGLATAFEKLTGRYDSFQFHNHIYDEQLKLEPEAFFACNESSFIDYVYGSESFIMQSLYEFTEMYWPVYIKFTIGPRNMTKERIGQLTVNLKMCGMTATRCTLMTVNDELLNSLIDSSMRAEFYSFSTYASVDHMRGYCVSKIEDIERGKREERDRKLVHFLEEMRQENDERTSGSSVNVNFGLNQDLYRTCVESILLYSCEVWSAHLNQEIETARLKYIKRNLGVRTSTPNDMVYAESGLSPLSITAQKRVIKFWQKIIDLPRHKYARILYDEIFYLCSKKPKCKSWAIDVKEMLDKNGFGDVWQDQCLYPGFPTILEQRLVDQYRQSQSSRLHEMSKARLYRHIKTDYEEELYLSDITIEAHRKAMSRIRLSSHNLMVEKMRWVKPKVDLPQRLCEYCKNDIEDEYHAILICTQHSQIRTKFIKPHYVKNPSMFKFINLLNTKNSLELRNLAKFCHYIQSKEP